MKIMKLFLLFSIAFFNQGVNAEALTGVKEVSIVIENVDAEARSCGVTQDLIDASIRLPLSNSKINISQGITRSYIYANVNILDIGSRCVLGLRLEFNKFINSEGESGSFWSKGYIAIWDKNNTGKKVSDLFETYTKQFVSAWLKANSK